MSLGANEAFSRVLIDKALAESGWNLLDPQQVRFELNGHSGRADYVLMSRRGGALCVTQAKREAEDDDAVETIVNEQFYQRPTTCYSPDKLVQSYGVPASTPAFVYNAVGRKPLPTRDAIVSDAVDSIASRFNLRYSEQKWVDTTAQLIAKDSTALRRFMTGDMTIFTANQFRTLGGLDELARFDHRNEVFEALRQSNLVCQSLLAA